MNTDCVEYAKSAVPTAPFRVRVSIRNARMLRAMERLGFHPGKDFAQKVGVSYVTINDTINLKRTPFDREGRVCDWVQRMADILETPITELFPDDMSLKLETNHSERDVRREELYALTHMPDDPSDYERKLDASGTVSRMLEHAKLTARENRVLAMRFGIGEDGEECTLEEAAERMSVTRERIRKIEQKIMRKMRCTPIATAIYKSGEEEWAR